MQHFDVIVVGGGVIGCSAAYYLSRIGARVLVLERAAFGGGASSANPGSVALSSKQPGLSMRLATASRILYETLPDELGADLEFSVDGNLTVAETEEELAFIEELAVKQRLAGVPARPVSADACRRLNFLLEGKLAGGIHCPVDAHLNPFLVTAGFARAASDHGVELRAGVEVQNIAIEQQGRFFVETSHGPASADFLVNATGVAAPRIGAMLGLAHQVIPRAGHVVVLEATTDLPLVKTASASQLMAKLGQSDAAGISLSYNRKPRSGTVLLGGSNQAGRDSREIAPEILAGVTAYGLRFMPALGKLHVMRAWVGVRPYVPGGPVLGPCGAPPRYLGAFGHGGDGMALAPVTGRYLAELVRRHPAPLALEEFLDVMPGPAELARLVAEIDARAHAA